MASLNFEVSYLTRIAIRGRTACAMDESKTEWQEGKIVMPGDKIDNLASLDSYDCIQVAGLTNSFVRII